MHPLLDAVGGLHAHPQQLDLVAEIGGIADISERDVLDALYVYR